MARAVATVARASRVVFQKSPLIGCLDRGAGTSVPAAYAGKVQQIYQINWSNCQAAAFGPLGGSDMTTIDSAIAAAVPFALRLIMGIHAPTGMAGLYDGTYSQTLTDGTTALPMTLSDSTSPASTHGQVYAFWTLAYRNAIANFYQQLMGYRGPSNPTVPLDQHPLLADIKFGEPSTIFAEFCQRGMGSSAQPAGLNGPSISQMICAGYTYAADYAAILAHINDSKQVHPFTLMGTAFNAFDHLLYGDGPGVKNGVITAGYAGTATASSSTSVTNGNAAYPTSGIQPSAVWIGYGRYRINSISTTTVSNDTITVPAAAVLSAMLAGDTVWIGGKVYSIFAVSNAAHTIQVAAYGTTTPAVSITNASNETGGVCMVWPATLAGLSASYKNYGMFALSSNTATVLTWASGGPTTSNALSGLEVIAMNANPSDQPSTDIFIAAACQRNPRKIILQNNGIRASTNLAPVGLNGAAVFSSFNYVGGLKGGQTAGDTVMNGTLTDTTRKLQTVIANLIAAGYIFIELPAGYMALYASTGATLSASNSGTPTQFAVQGSPNWANDQWGTSPISNPGNFGILTMTGSGNQYYVSNDSADVASFANTVLIYQQLGNASQTSLISADQAAGLGYTLQGPNYLTPAQCAAYNAQFQANYNAIGLAALIRNPIGQKQPTLVTSSAFVNSGTGSITGSFDTIPVAGNMLLARLGTNQTGPITVNDPNWVQIGNVVATPTAQAALFWKRTAAGNDTAPIFSSPGGTMKCCIDEFNPQGGTWGVPFIGSDMGTASPLVSIASGLPATLYALQVEVAIWRLSSADAASTFSHSPRWVPLSNSATGNQAQKIDGAYLASLVPLDQDVNQYSSSLITSVAILMATFPITFPSGSRTAAV